MPSVTEGRLTFDFPDGWTVDKLDEWSFYRNQFQKIAGGAKSVDLLAVEAECCWLIEVKDYRHHPREKPTSLADEMAIKVRDSLAMLAAARVNAADVNEISAAQRALRRNLIRVVLHLEPAPVGSRLFSPILDAANVKQRLTQQLKAVDAHPWVGTRTDMYGCAWNVAG